MKIDKKIITRIIVAVWIGLWLLFLVRPYFKKDLIGEYRTLIVRSLEGKRSFTLGDELYDFVTNCRYSVPKERFTFSVDGLDDDQLAKCRIAYYLYPAVCVEDAEYIFVFKKADYKKDGYAIFRMFGQDKYILKKAK